MTELFLDTEGTEGLDVPALEKAMATAAEADAPLVLELLFVSGEEIRALNARERGVDRVTDVLSFPAMELTAGEPIVSDEHGECMDEDRLLIGSVVICTERAKEQAAEYGHSEARELGYLSVHGFLHCLGYDHETDEDRAAMRAEEERIMNLVDLRRDA